MAEEEGPQALSLQPGHDAGHTVAAFIRDSDTWALLTAGADGRLVVRPLRPGPELRSAQAAGPAGMSGLDVCVAGDSWSVALLDGSERKNTVTAWRLPQLEAGQMPLLRLGNTPRCCCFSKDGKRLFAGGDDGAVKAVGVADRRALATLRFENEGFVRGLALDPEGQFVAAATADGVMAVWEFGEDGRSSSFVQRFKKRLAPKLDHEDPLARQALAWHPDGGSLLAVAGQEHGSVVLLERLSWAGTKELVGGHSSSVRVISFSPNGIYAATACAEGKVVVWEVENERQLSSRQLPAAASSLAWHPAANMLLVGCASGGYGLWPCPVPESEEEGLPSPCKPLDEVLRDADRRAAAAAAAAASESEVLEDDGVELDGAAAGVEAEAEEDDEDGGGLFARRRQPDGGEAATTADASRLDSLLDELEQGDAQRRAAAAPRVVVAAPKPKPPQAPVHAGATPAGEGGARFLAFNRLGCVVSKAVDEHHVVEVAFHDTAKHRQRVPNLTDLYGLHAAALGAAGVAYISRSKDTDLAGEEPQPSMLVYRGFASWATGSDWMVALPAGEEALVVAAGASAVAVATSSQMLRLYSPTGRPLGLVSLPGPPVAMAAAGPVDAGEDAQLPLATQHLLAVVWADGSPEALHGTQQLSYAVFDASRAAQCCSGRVALSRGASLRWLAFSKEGLLATMDSTGTLRLRSPEWGGAWWPVLDAAGAKASHGADALWPVWLDRSHLTAVVTSTQARHPPVLPRPLVTPIPLSVPLVPAEAAAGELEQQSMFAALLAAQLKAAGDGADDGADAAGLAGELEAAQVEADRANLRLLNAYMKAGKQARALELVGSLHSLKSIEGALRLATHFHHNTLAERIQAFLEQRREWEEAQQVQQQQLAGLGALAGAAGGGFGDDDMQGQLDQASQQGDAGGSQAPGAKQHSALGGGSGRAGGAAAAAAGGALKRKPTAADAATAGGGRGANPFARRKVTK